MTKIALIVNGNGVTVNQATGGARVFNSTTTGLLTLNGMTICDMTYREVVANPPIPQNAFDIPADQLAKAGKTRESEEAIQRGRLYRKRLGGAMRQVGVLPAQ